MSMDSDPRKKLGAVNLLFGLYLSLNLRAFAQPDPYLFGGNQHTAVAIQAAQQAKKAFQMGDYATCIRIVSAALSKGAADLDSQELLALAYAESGDEKNAALRFQSVINRDGRSTKFRNNYGVFLFKTGDFQKAETQFRDCIRIDPSYPDAHYHLGELLLKKAQTDKAIEEMETAVKLRPTYFEAQRDLGLAIYESVVSGRAGEISDSLSRLEIAAKLNPDNAPVHYYLATIYCADGKLDMAEKELRDALAVDPQLAIAHYELGRLRYYRGDLDRCVIELKAAQAVSTEYTDGKKYPPVDITKLQLLLSKAEEFKGDYGQSIDHLREVASMQKNNAESLKRIKELERSARADLKKRGKLTFSPEQLQSLINKGIAQTEDNQLALAKETFEQVLTLDPSNVRALQNHGAVEEASGDLQSAMQDYKKALDLMPKYDGLYYNIGYLLEKMGLPQDAGLMYQRFHEVAGSYPYDPKHIVALQQEDARQRARQEQIRKRGY